MRRRGYLLGSRRIEIVWFFSRQTFFLALLLTIFFVFPLYVWWESVPPFLSKEEPSKYSLQLRVDKLNGEPELLRRLGETDFNIMGFALHGPAEPKLQYFEDIKIKPFWASLLRLPIESFDQEVCFSQNSYFESGGKRYFLKGDTLIVFYANRSMSESKDLASLHSSEITKIEVSGTKCESDPAILQQLVTRIGVSPGKVDFDDIVQGVNAVGKIGLRGTDISVDNASSTGTFLSQERMRRFLSSSPENFFADLTAVQTLQISRKISFIQWLAVLIVIFASWWVIAWHALKCIRWLARTFGELFKRLRTPSRFTF